MYEWIRLSTTSGIIKFKNFMCARRYIARNSYVTRFQEGKPLGKYFQIKNRQNLICKYAYRFVDSKSHHHMDQCVILCGLIRIQILAMKEINIFILSIQQEAAHTITGFYITPLYFRWFFFTYSFFFF